MVFLNERSGLGVVNVLASVRTLSCVKVVANVAGLLMRRLLFALACSFFVHAMLFLWHDLGGGGVHFSGAGNYKVLGGGILIRDGRDASSFDASAVKADKERGASVSSESKPQRIEAPANSDLPKMLGLANNGYYSTDVLTRRPVALSDVFLEKVEIDSGETADRPVLFLWIGVTGLVEKVSVDQSDYDVALVQPILDAFRALRFAPGEINGQAVPVVMKIEVFY